MRRAYAQIKRVVMNHQVIMKISQTVANAGAIKAEWTKMSKKELLILIRYIMLLYSL